MRFNDDTLGPCFTALGLPYISPALDQPDCAPTTLFSGSIPAVHFAPVPAHEGVKTISTRRSGHLGGHHATIRSHAHAHPSPSPATPATSPKIVGPGGYGEHIDLKA